ncbi:MAG: hypothetical protein COV48_02810 [Elusimicrobia bacterium CG11_big_fil_rev_8_21_14_0_20_64_6]|nr:MAG: hypothetical protein COV48_02810 [Elusimicrobia bacterium CG11_big_fil_rev_8_21_14_0_20_64_6]
MESGASAIFFWCSNIRAAKERMVRIISERDIFLRREINPLCLSPSAPSLPDFCANMVSWRVLA